MKKHCDICSGWERPCVVCGTPVVTTAAAGEPVACCFGHHNDAIDYGHLNRWFDVHGGGE
jgi:hypothetical protein